MFEFIDILPLLYATMDVCSVAMQVIQKRYTKVTIVFFTLLGIFSLKVRLGSTTLPP